MESKQQPEITPKVVQEKKSLKFDQFSWQTEDTSLEQWPFGNRNIVAENRYKLLCNEIDPTISDNSSIRIVLKFGDFYHKAISEQVYKKTKALTIEFHLDNDESISGLNVIGYLLDKKFPNPMLRMDLAENFMLKLDAKIREIAQNFCNENQLHVVTIFRTFPFLYALIEIK
jgi:hypothetical protein